VDFGIGGMQKIDEEPEPVGAKRNRRVYGARFGRGAGSGEGLGLGVQIAIYNAYS